MNTFEILTAKSRFDLMHWIASIGPDKWPIFGRFLALFALNTSNMSNMVDVRR
jgi:hypothetical protein